MSSGTPGRVPSRRANRRRRRGVTLVEAAAAVVVLSVGVPPLVIALADAGVEQTESVKSTQAEWLCVEKMEEVLADRHNPARGMNYLVPGHYLPENPVMGFAGFARSVTFEQTGADLATPGTGYIKVEVRVTWESPRGTHSVRVATVVTELE